MISVSKLKKLPDAPGVYIFKNGTGKVMYVGKATSLRNRVRSYFARNLSETRGPLVVQLVAAAKKIDFIETDTVLEALILEANLIKKYQPHHNTKEKDDKSFNHVVITNENFPRILVVRGREIEKLYSDPRITKEIYGPFPNGSSLREALKIVRRIFPYRDNRCLLPNPISSNTSNTQPKPCFNRQIGLCPGTCTGEISQKEYARTIRHIRLFFDGKKKVLLKSLERDMKKYAKNLEFEKANQVKRTVFSLKHIQDVALIHREKNGIDTMTGFGNRIEAYDIAHISGTSTVGVMTVVENGEANPAEYRMFKIRQEKGGDDLKSLGEVLARRFTHPEWTLPTLVVIDGGETHLNFAQKKLAELNMTMPVVSVVKDEHHKPKDVFGDIVAAKKFRSEILLANSEAHRFAIKYHTKLRNRAFL